MRKFLFLAAEILCVLGCLIGCSFQKDYTPLGSESEVVGNWVWSENPEVQVNFDGKNAFEFVDSTLFWDGVYNFDGRTLSAETVVEDVLFPKFTASIKKDGKMKIRGVKGYFTSRGLPGIQNEEHSGLLTVWTNPLTGNSFSFSETNVEMRFGDSSNEGVYYFDGTHLILDFNGETYTGILDSEGDLIFEEIEDAWFSAPGNNEKLEAYYRENEALFAKIVGVWHNETTHRKLEIQANKLCEMYTSSPDAESLQFSSGTYTHDEDGENLYLHFDEAYESTSLSSFQIPDEQDHPLEVSFDSQENLMVEGIDGTFTKISDQVDPSKSNLLKSISGGWHSEGETLQINGHEISATGFYEHDGQTLAGVISNGLVVIQDDLTIYARIDDHIRTGYLKDENTLVLQDTEYNR